MLVLAVTVSSASDVCASCHTMRPYASALEASPHKSVSCYACHLDTGAWDFPGFKAREAAVMYPRGLVSREASPTGPGIHTAMARCLSCHEAVLAGRIEKNGVRIVHETCVEEGGTCDSCHSGAAHSTASRWPREYDMERCVVCHDRVRASKQCDSCHAAKLERQRLATSTWRVTHGPGWQKNHGLGSVTYCVTCHPRGYCKRCHGVDMPHPASFTSTHGGIYRQRPDSCAKCHSTERFCDNCHGVRMPHAATFLKQHPGIAKARLDPICTRCHYPEDCDGCHVKHTHPGSTDGRIGRTVKVP
ncbi:MAG: hypothetical protein C0418_04165 [Coriobacteriaceae bacterium]|nr:hypothetical protein [Coriobacteriaceae bacterium]